MPFQYLTNTPLDEALANYKKALLEAGLKACDSETIPASESCGRITSGAIYARISSPYYNACAMDGIAVLASDTAGATETTPVTLHRGDYDMLDTGDPLPDGKDAVIMIEDAVFDDDGNVKLHSAAAPWQHVRQIGEDICAGDMLLTSFTEITPSAVGAMLAAGVLGVEVVKKPRVAIIPTGDEVMEASAAAGEAAPAPGGVLEFNSAIFKSMLKQWGADADIFPIAKDNLSDISKALNSALSSCDAVLINAGSSAGRDDYTSQAIESVGNVLYHGLAIRPGKPAVLGLADRGGTCRPILGVPGYPVSGIIVLEEVFRPILDMMTGRSALDKPEARAVLGRAVTSSLKYREFIRVRLGNTGGRRAGNVFAEATPLTAVPLNRGAGVVTSFVKADGIIDVPQNSEGFDAGAEVAVTLLRPLSEIERSLVITGSHDPLIDELADIIKKMRRGVSTASAHVGSMGGIIAVKRGEAHAAGIHLLDEETGGYNIPWLKRYFPGPDSGVILMECVMRQQGLMVQKGNPKGLHGVRDLASQGLKYVNRQKGSGTRVLCDYLCRREGIDTGAIYGYEREEFTHTAVAALVASGSADAGMGIYSAAKLCGLDFIPLCMEQYDLLIPESELESEQITLMRTALESREFRERLGEMGGYELDSPGRIRARL